TKHWLDVAPGADIVGCSALCLQISGVILPCLPYRVGLWIAFVVIAWPYPTGSELSDHFQSLLVAEHTFAVRIMNIISTPQRRCPVARSAVVGGDVTAEVPAHQPAPFPFPSLPLIAQMERPLLIGPPPRLPMRLASCPEPSPSRDGIHVHA